MCMMKPWSRDDRTGVELVLTRGEEKEDGDISPRLAWGINFIFPI